MLDLIGFIESLDRPRVAVFGDLALDRYTHGLCDAVSPEAPVPVLRVVRRENRLGGAAGAAANVLALGGQVACVGVVGEDAAGDELLRTLAGLGGDVTSVLRIPGRPTTTRERLIGLAQRRHPQQLLRVDEGETARLADDVLDRVLAGVRAALRETDVLVVKDGGAGVVHERLLPEVMAAARAAEVPVIVDPVRDGGFARYRGATLLTPNREEAEQAAGQAILDDASLERVAARLAEEAQAAGMLITLGAEGSYLKLAGEPGQRVLTEPRRVYDVTGAGEAVLAMLAVARAGGADWDAAAALANVAGGLEVERFGAVPIRRAELLAELVRLKRQQHGKVVTREELLLEVRRLRAAGKRIVWTNGCFDIIHAGHAEYLNYARRQGDALVVAINSDASVRRNKGPNRPIVGEEDRAEVLAGLECVDYVVVFDGDTPLDLIQQVRPDVLVKGAQWAGAVVGQEFVESTGGRVVLAPMRENRSTTNIIERITQVYGKHS